MTNRGFVPNLETHNLAPVSQFALHNQTVLKEMRN